jgi:hypothetical protein
MTIDSVTVMQYSGYPQKFVRDSYEVGKVNPDNEEARVQGVLKEERERVQPVAHTRGRVIEPQMLEKGVKQRRIEFREFGKFVDVLV